MGGVMQWLRENVLPKLRSWGRGFALGVQGICKKVPQGVGWIATLVLGAGALFFAWLAYDAYSGLKASPEDKANWALEFLKFYAYAVGGIILIWQVRIANRRATALENTASLGEKSNITERFKNAIEHLGGESESIRMGGIYGLYHVAQESRGYADTVLKILCAHAKSIMAEPGYVEKEKPSNEIAAILDVLFPVIPDPDSENQKIKVLFEKVDISGWHLQGANISNRNMKYVHGVGVHLLLAQLPNADLSEADLSEANLSATSLWDANLSGAHLSWANLSGVDLGQGNLRGAHLLGANLSHANLSEADLSEANLLRADLSATNLSGAKLSGAKLLGANLSGTNLSAANLSGAELLAANLSAANLSNANLSRVNIIIEQLLQAKTLNGAKLNDHTHEEIMRRSPELLAPPVDSPDEEE